MTESESPCAVLMWKRPVLALLLLGCGTLVWYNCGPLQHSALSLLSDVLFTFVCSLGLLGVLCRHLNLSIPVDPLEWQVSSDMANDIAACLANTVGAAEGVLRVAASGSDSKLFFKVVGVLLSISAIGRAASGATVAYIVLWFMFIIPFSMSKLVPEVTCQTPNILQKGMSFMAITPPSNSPRLFCSPWRLRLFT